MPEGREDTEVTVETHSLLLSLAGLVDDELLGWCRELVAVGESDYAIELVTGSVQADRVRLPIALHDQLLAAASRRQLLGRFESLPLPDPAPRSKHRFLADPTLGGFPVPTAASSPEDALRRVPVRLLRDCQLRLAWRTTPAGAAPGPLPHPVVLIETAEAAGADVLAYQVGEVLSRAGVFASVEVYPAEADLGDYHRAALAESRPIDPIIEPLDHLGSAPRRPDPPRPHPEPGVRDSVRRPDEDQRRAGPAGDSTRSTGRAALRPVDRVITARGSTPLRPRPDRSGLDDLAAGLTFDRSVGNADRLASDDHFADFSDGIGVDETPSELSRADRRPEERSRDPLWSPSNELPTQPSDDLASSSGTGGFLSAGEPTGTARSARPNRSSARPEDLPEPPPGLSDVEQRLLRQLHEELAAREDDDDPSDDATQSARAFHNTNGGRKPRPPRSLGGSPPDRAS